MDKNILNEDLIKIDELIKSKKYDLSLKYISNGSFWKGSIKLDKNIFYFHIRYTWYYPIVPPHVFCYRGSG